MMKSAPTEFKMFLIVAACTVGLIPFGGVAQAERLQAAPQERSQYDNADPEHTDPWCTYTKTLMMSGQASHEVAAEYIYRCSSTELIYKIFSEGDKASCDYLNLHRRRHD